MRNLKSRRGVTMVELLGVMIVIGILLLVAGSSVSKNIKRSNREAVVNDLQMYATSLADAYYDLGSPSIVSGESSSDSEFRRYLSMVQSDYLAVTFDMDTLTATSTGYFVEIASPLDVFESRYHCWFVTDDSVMKYAMIASGGENGIVDSESYGNQEFKDDIVLIVRPKV